MNVVCFNAEKFYRIAYDYLHYEDNLNLAEKWVKMALDNDGSHIKSKILTGEIYLAKNEAKKALEIFLNIDKISPSNPMCLLNIAKAYKLTGNYKLALKYLDKVFVKKVFERDEEILDECYDLKANLLSGMSRYQKILHVNF